MKIEIHLWPNNRNHNYLLKLVKPIVFSSIFISSHAIINTIYYKGDDY